MSNHDFKVGDQVRLLIEDAGGVNAGAEGVVRAALWGKIDVYWYGHSSDATSSWYPYYCSSITGSRYTIEKFIEKIENIWDELELQ